MRGSFECLLKNIFVSENVLCTGHQDYSDRQLLVFAILQFLIAQDALCNRVQFLYILGFL